MNAAEKMGEGFSTLAADDTNDFKPRNTVTSARGGDDVYYWIQWKEPIPSTALRCVIKGPDTNIDETDNYEETGAEGYSVCGLGSEKSDGGTFTFTQYLDGKKVGEKTIEIQKGSIFRMSLYRKWKWFMSGLGLVILIGYWLRRKFTGDKRSLKDVLGGEEPVVASSSRETPVIGARLNGGAVMAGVATAVASQVDEAAELQKLGKQFQLQMAQADKAKGIELGRNYLSQLLKARDHAEAVKVFKECVAADAAFRPASAEEVFAIAKAARGAGDAKVAVAALRGFDKIYPGHSLIPDMYLFSAKLLSEDLKNIEMARKILEHILAKYPGHYLAQEAKRYLASMPKAG